MNLFFIGRVVAILVAVSAALSPTRAATIVWTNTSGGNWNAATNWSPNQVPGAADMAVITNAGTYTVTLNTSPTVAGLAVGATGGGGTQTFSAAGNSLTVNGTGVVNSRGVFNLDGGTLIGAFTVTGGAAMNWTGGTLGNGSALTIATNAVLKLDGTVGKNIFGGLTNAGTINWTNTGNLNIYNDGGTSYKGSVNNLTGGMFNVQNDQTISTGGYGFESFSNAGTFRKSAGAGTTTISVPLANNGLMDLQSGTVSFNGPLTTTGTFSGAGSVVLSGVVSGTLNGTMNWISGTLGNGSALTIASNAVLNLIGASGKNIFGGLTNAGTINWTNTGNLNIYNDGGSSYGGSINNLAGGWFNVQNDQAIVCACYGPEYFNNAGTFRKLAGAGTTTISVPFTNSGTVDLPSGTVSFNSALNTTGNFSGSGSVVFGGVVSGTLNGTMNWISGTLGSSSTLTIATNAVLNLVGASAKSIFGPLTNAGTINWTNTGNLTIYNDGGVSYKGAIINLAGGLFNVQNDQTISCACYGSEYFSNAGTFRKSSGSGTTTVNVAFTNNGTVDVQSGTVSFNAPLNTTGSFSGAGSVVLNGPVTGTLSGPNLVVNGGTVSGAFVLNGTLDWAGGTLGVSSSMTIATNGVLNLSGSGTKNIYGRLTNAGTVNWTGTGNVTLYNDGGASYQGAIINLSGALFIAQNDQAISVGYGSEFFSNAGTFRKSPGTGTTTIGVTLTNTGTVDVQSGTISFNGALNTTGSFTGAGLVTLNGAVIGTLNGTLNWASGSLGQGSSLTVASNSVLNLSGSSGKNILGGLTNSGTINWAGTGNLTLYNNGGAPYTGSIINLAGGLFNIQNDQVISLAYGSEFFSNAGTFRKSAGAATTTVGIAFTNTGTVDVQSGLIAFNGLSVQTSGHTLLDGGSLSFAQPFQLLGGALAGTNTISGSVTNSAVVSPGGDLAAGKLTITGTYVQTPLGSLNVELGGTNAGVTYDRLQINGAATLGGTLNVTLIDPFTPVVSNVFRVATYSSFSGDFATVNGLSIYTNLSLVETLLATNLDLTAVATNNTTITPPQIVTQPQSQTIINGETVGSPGTELEFAL